MSNPMKDYVDNFRANLPSGVTFESVTARYFFNGKRFISEWDVERYREYIIKFGFSVEPDSFTFASLYENGEDGFVWDLGDISTLYQDAARTNPVTATGQEIRGFEDVSGNGYFGATASGETGWEYRETAGGSGFAFQAQLGEQIDIPVALNAGEEWTFFIAHDGTFEDISGFGQYMMGSASNEAAAGNATGLVAQDGETVTTFGTETIDRIKVDGSVITPADRDALHDQTLGTSKMIYDMTIVSVNVWTSTRIGAYPANSNRQPPKGVFVFGAINRRLTPAEETDIEALFTDRFGLAGIITASSSPTLGELLDGDQVQDGLAASATDPANYASTAGTISSVVESVTINGSPGALTDVVSTSDEVSVEITVTDSTSEVRVFNAGTQTVVTPIITATIEPAFATATNGSRVGDLLSENALEQFNYNSMGSGIEDGFPFIVVTIDGLTESPFSGREYDLENYVFSEQTLSAEVFVEDFAGNSRVFQTNEQTLPAGSAPAVLTNPTIPEVPLPGQTITVSNGNYSNDDFAFGGVLTVGGMPVNITGFLDGGTVSYQIPFGTEIGTVIEWQEESASGLVSSVQVTVVAADPSIVPEFTIVWDGTDSFIASDAELILEVT